jgi:hypothetical protein
VKLPVFSLALVLAAGTFTAFADELDDAYQALKDAQAKKDVALVKKAAADANAAAQEVIESPAPDKPELKKNWEERKVYAKEVATHAEYALFSLALESPPAVQVDLFATLEAQNPKSQYLDDAYPRYFQALTQTGAAAKIIPLAEKALAKVPDNVDLLLILTDDAASKNQADKALSLANRLVAAAGKMTKQEGVAAADFEKKKAGALSRGYYTAGVISGQKNLYMAADKNLRAALPLIQGNNAMMGPALYFLGFANYNLGKMTNSKAKVLEGAAFSDKAAQIQGPYQSQAWKNAQAMKTEAAAMR